MSGVMREALYARWDACRQHALACSSGARCVAWRAAAANGRACWATAHCASGQLAVAHLTANRLGYLDQRISAECTCNRHAQHHRPMARSLAQACHPGPAEQHVGVQYHGGGPTPAASAFCKAFLAVCSTMTAAGRRCRAVPALAVLGAALIALAATYGLPPAQLLRVTTSRVAVTAAQPAKPVQASAQAGPGRATPTARRVQAPQTQSSSATGGVASPKPTASAAAEHSTPQAAAPAEERQLPPPEQLRSRVAAFRKRLAASQPAMEQAWGERLEGLRPRGVVTAAGSPYSLANAFVGLFVLRHSLGCQLPFVVM